MQSKCQGVKINAVISSSFCCSTNKLTYYGPTFQKKERVEKEEEKQKEEEEKVGGTKHLGV